MVLMVVSDGESTTSYLSVLSLTLYMGFLLMWSLDFFIFFFFFFYFFVSMIPLYVSPALFPSPTLSVGPICLPLFHSLCQFVCGCVCVCMWVCVSVCVCVEVRACLTRCAVVPSLHSQEKNDKSFQIIEMRVLSNWGHAEYNCLYRLRVQRAPRA